MSLATSIGREHNVFSETAGYARRIQFESPVMMYSDLKQLKAADEKYYKHHIISLNFDPNDEDMEAAVRRVCAEAVRVVREEKVVLVILTDRAYRTRPDPYSGSYGCRRCASCFGG